MRLLRLSSVRAAARGCAAACLAAVGAAVAAGMSAGLLAGCGADGASPQRPAPTEPPPGTAPRYEVAPPAGKLPWPQHAPTFGPVEYGEMLRDLQIATNFGLYQARDEFDGATTYLHNGLDIALGNGTPIHAVQSGWVRVVDQRFEFYKLLIVEDADAPGHGWGYVHVDDFRVRPGDYVPQGTMLARVRFQGLEHVHLNRLRLLPGGRWEDGLTQVHTQPDTFFVYTDTEAPRFEGAFRYYRDESDSLFARAPGGAATIAGDVDVVVGLRDVGEHTRGRSPAASAFSDRLAISRLEYAIVPLGGAADTARARRVAFDLTTLAIPRVAQTHEHALTEVLFKFYRAVQPRGAPPWWSTKTSFYVLTNAPAGGQRMLTADDRALSWRTAERDASGTPRWPNGAYLVTAWARDFKGNVATRADTVLVRN